MLRRKLRRGALLLIAVAAIVVLIRVELRVSPPPSSSIARELVPEAEPAPRALVDDLEQRLVDLTNEQRTLAALRPLDRDLALSAAARRHSEDMLRRGFFDHVNPAGESPADRVARTAVKAGAIGENIWQWSASDRLPTDALAGQAVAEWMASAAHRANILRPSYTRFGVGAAADGSNVRLTELFME